MVSTTGVTWYDSAIGNTVVPNPTISAIGTATYYAEYFNGTCSSLTRTAVVLTINESPAAPTSTGNITACETNPIQTLDANDALVSTTGITWYDNAIGGTVVPSPTISATGTATYYAEYDNGTCTSLTRTTVTLTITAAPAAPTSIGDITSCEANPIVPLDANDALISITGVTWYTSATGRSCSCKPNIKFNK